MTGRPFNMENKFDVIVIGAGASGLAAAIEAARAGASVLVLEKNHVPGRKLLSTGSGKCNFSNLEIKPSAYHPPRPAFLKKVFSSLPPAEVLSFFKELGLLWTEREKGRLFPRSLKAQDIANLLLNQLELLKVRIQTLTEARSVSMENGSFLVEAEKTAPKWDKSASPAQKAIFRAGRLILAAGGAAYPQIGGGSGGYRILRELGHAVAEISPAVVPLRIKGNFVKEMEGVRLDAVLTLRTENSFLAKTAGELLFTSYGISGPAVLDLSRAALSALAEGPAFIEADFFPDYKTPELERLLAERAASFSGRPFRHFTCGLLNGKVIRAAAARAGIDWDAPALPGCAPGLAAALKSFTLEAAGSLGFEDAMVTAGGCALSEVNPQDFASRKIKGLYVTGELLDLDGDSGGYNLHLAWTSGILAGRSAGRKQPA